MLPMVEKILQKYVRRNDEVSHCLRQCAYIILGLEKLIYDDDFTNNAIISSSPYCETLIQSKPVVKSVMKR